MLQAIIISVTVAVVSGVIMLIVKYFANLIDKNIKMLIRKMDYIDKKHDALVYALHKWSGNGFMKDYRASLDDTVQQDNFINK